MKKINFAIILFISLCFLYTKLTKPHLQPIFIKKDEILKEENQKYHEIYENIDIINKKNSLIKNVQISNIKIKVKQNLTINVMGNLSMEKDKFFRLKVWHKIYGLEMDIGSNNELFWFWSKRMDDPALYFAKHENLEKTMLKTPLNPIWLMESLNVGNIEKKDIKIIPVKDFWAILSYRKSSLGEPVQIATLIDAKNNVIIGRYLYDKKGNLTASSEVKEFKIDKNSGILIPKKLFIIWYEENISMEWNLSHYQINTKMNKSLWELPNINKKIEMGN